ncbi:hypothetical protein GCM10022393_13140 [Aquimarina addita]|uniref:Right handed beta helix domain-containing protein n=1 Tax=Aquimarina addita TaxID=870485 RepID=A0ABP7XF29_9FLAO
MKTYILIVLTILFVGCKDKINNTAENKKNPVSVKEIKYVNAESGLNYRDNPKGKKLGKFNFNDKLIIASHTGIFQTVSDGPDSINGEWVSTLISDQEVYILSSFLSDIKSKSTAEINSEIDSLNEVEIKKSIAEELSKSTQQRMDEYQFIKEEYLNSYKNRYKDLPPGSRMLESMKLEEKWTEQVNEDIKPVKDTVVVIDEVSLLKNLKSNRVFLIDTAVLNFHQNEVILSKESMLFNRHFLSTQLGILLLRNLKNVEFIGRKQRVYFISYAYGQSLLELLDVQKFVFKNFCFYYPPSEYDLEQQKENLNKEDTHYAAIEISGGHGKFINCNIKGAFLGADIYNIYDDEGITFEKSTFTNIQKNVIALNTATNIVFNNVTIRNNDCKSVFQMKEDEGLGSHGNEEISINNSLISDNKTKKLIGFGKSFDNRVMSSNVKFRKCKIQNNSFQRTFLDFNYKEQRNAAFYNCKITNNKIFDDYEGYSPFFLSGNLDYSVKFNNTSFKSNDWKITKEEREKYFE